MQVSNAKDSRGGRLLCFTDDGTFGLGVRRGVTTGITGGHEAVGDLNTKARQRGDGTGGTKVNVIGMGDHGERTLNFAVVLKNWNGITHRTDSLISGSHSAKFFR